MKRKALSFLLAFSMVLGLLPGGAFAAETAGSVSFTAQPTSAEYTVGDTADDLTVSATYTIGEDAQTYTVTEFEWYKADGEEGEFSKIDGVTGDTYADVSTGTAGTTRYYAKAIGRAGETVVEADSDTATITVTEKEEEALGLTSLTVATGGYYFWDRTTLTLSPTFGTETTEYSVDALNYASANSNARKLFVTAAAAEGATIQAECNGSTATVTSGAETQVGTYVLEGGKENVLTITVSKDGQEKTYTVTIPMKASFKFKTNLSAGGLYSKDTQSIDLAVAMDDSVAAADLEVSYQWYTSDAKVTSLADATLIEDATGISYTVDMSKLEVGTPVYYCVTATCADYGTLVSTVTEITLSAYTKPESITILHAGKEVPHNNWSELWALGAPGDTFQFTAVDQNGEETPVNWSCNGGTVENGLFTLGNNSSGNYVPSRITATSRFAGGTSLERNVVIHGYTFSKDEYTVTLSTDGQSAKTVYATGGYKGHTVWSHTAGETVATLATDLTEKGNSIKFNALRPGSFQVSFALDLEGYTELKDEATFTITGIAVEDPQGTQGKTYVEVNGAEGADQVQLTAYTTDNAAVTSWTSSDETIATVDAGGKVTGLKAGTVQISATDGAYTGGIKVVVEDGATPYFESLGFVGNGWSGMSGWTTTTFSPATTEYTGLSLKYNEVPTLTDATLFNEEKYTAKAAYTDRWGNPMGVELTSGAQTALTDFAFDTSMLTITLTDKEDGEKSTAYTFEITRARDTTEQAKFSSGFTLIPDGRELSANKYEGYKEGTIFHANEDGSLKTNTWGNYTTGVANGTSQLYYRTFAQNGLEAFALTLKASTDYAHMRYSTDGGSVWHEVTQGGGNTDMIAFPQREGETNPVVAVQIQVLDDKTYSDNVKAGKEGFAEGTPVTYTLWVEQLPASGMKLESASTDLGYWYPAFDPEQYSYNIVVGPEEAAPVLTYTVAEGATSVMVGAVAQTPDGDGNYTLQLTGAYQNVIVTGEKGTATYQFRYSSRVNDRVPDRVLDYLPINSQYTNNGNYGLVPERTLTGGDVLSLGNFGGYITYYYEDALTDDPKNKYGVDLYITGNAGKDTSTATGLGFMEPGQVWVSEDGETWYALAGSEHYEDTTLWDYQVTYSKTELGKTAWKDNQGNQDNGTQVGAWPSASYYPLNGLLDGGDITMTGLLIPCWDGSLTGNGTFASYSRGARFGYVDVQPNSALGEDANPYLKNSDHTLETSGFDLAWAVDENGLPVDVSDMQFHYVKVVTASNLWAGSANEKSTEVGAVMRTAPQSGDVGVTAAPTGVTISNGETSKEIAFAEGQQVYEAALGAMKYVSVTVNGTAEGDNIYVNNQRVASGAAAEGIKVTTEGKLVRVIVQNGEKEPVIYLLKLTSDIADDALIESVKINADGIDRVAETTDGANYTASVGYRVASIGIVTVPADLTLTINGEAPRESYDLAEGENTFTILAEKEGVEQTVTLKVTKEAAPESTGDIRVFFTLLGDEKHGEDGSVHTLKDKNLVTWISATTYTVPDTYKVVDVLQLALDEHGMDHENPGGNYVSSINGLAEFDNGPRSGWMYTLNGVHSDYGVAEQGLENGDRIVFHYTDDHDLEDYTGSGYTPDSGSGGSTAIEEEGAVTIAPEATANSQGEAKAEVDGGAVTEALEQAKEEGVSAIVVAPAVTGEASKVTVTLPQNAVEEIAEDSGLALTVETSVANVTVPNGSLNDLAGQDAGDVSISAEAVKDGSGAPTGEIRVEIHVGDKTVSDLSDGVAVTIPAAGNTAGGEETTPSPTQVLVIVNEDGTETIVKKSVAGENGVTGLLDGSATVKVVDNAVDFPDTKDHWAEEAIDFAASRNLLQGTGSDFDPDGPMTRAMLVTVLYRLEDGAASVGHDFPDVPDGQWYSDAVAWANASGIVQGTGSGFDPHGKVSREQIAVILFRYAGYLGLDTSHSADLEAQFADHHEVSDWAKEGKQWAVAAGLIQGTGSGLFSPGGDASRAEAAAMFQRLIGLMLQ